MSSQALQVRPERARSFFSGFSPGQLVMTLVAALLVSIAGGALSVWVTQARTNDRLEQVEKAQEKTVTREVLDERWKTVERIDKNVEKIRDALFEERKVDRK